MNYNKRRRWIINMANIAFMGLFSIIILVIYLALLGIGIYGFVLFVKLATRGIKALDIYIDEKTSINKS
jgi:hypothetical protein